MSLVLSKHCGALVKCICYDLKGQMIEFTWGYLGEVYYNLKGKDPINLYLKYLKCPL